MKREVGDVPRVEIVQTPMTVKASEAYVGDWGPQELAVRIE